MTQMIEVKTAELVGPALDWVVAQVEDMRQHTPTGLKYTYWYASERCIGTHWSPSTNWSQGGPLIEKHLVTIGSDSANDRLVYWAYAGIAEDGYPCIEGESHLVAACRAIVAAKLGDVVSVPAELA